MAFERFRGWYERRHDYVKEWLGRTGGKAVGVFCTYAPEEILYAADLLPVRVYGSHEPQSVTEPHIFGMFCPWTRDVLAQGLQGRYGYLSGVILAQTCLHFRQAFSSWCKHVPTDFSYLIPMPHGVQSKHGPDYYAAELGRFKTALEGWIGRPIGDDDLERGIEVVDENRRLLRQIYELRQAESPPISGVEALWLVASAQMTDKREHNAAMRELLPRLQARTLGRPTGERLMIIGSENDDVAFVEMVEGLGTTFVVDENCVGTRYFWGETPADGGDPLHRIARRYLSRPACPAKDWPALTRWPHIQQLIKAWGVQGAILMQQKFCDPHELDLPRIKKRLEADGVPTLFLEFDVTTPVGQFKTRVEAFLEMMRQSDLFGDDLY